MNEQGSTIVDSGERRWEGGVYSSSYEARYTYRRVEELKTIEGGVNSYTPPPTPEPCTTSRTGWGESCHTSGHWRGNQEQGVGRKSVRKADGWTTGDHALLEVDG